MKARTILRLALRLGLATLLVPFAPEPGLRDGKVLAHDLPDAPEAPRRPAPPAPTTGSVMPVPATRFTPQAAGPMPTPSARPASVPAAAPPGRPTSPEPTLRPRILPPAVPAPRNLPPALAASPLPLPPALPGGTVPLPPPMPVVSYPPLPPIRALKVRPPGDPLPEGTVRILSDQVRYDRATRLALVKGNVRIHQSDSVIATSEARYDQKARVTTIDVPFELVQDQKGEPRTTVQGLRMRNEHDRRLITVDGDVELVRVGNPAARPDDPSRKSKLRNAFRKEDMVIRADHMDYQARTKDAAFTGKVRFIQREKHATGDRARVDHAKQTVTLDDHVVLTQIKGDWLSREGIVDTSQPDADRDKALGERTVIIGDHLVVDQRTSDATITGSMVTVAQKGRRVTGRRADYKDSDQTITITQDVLVQRDDGSFMRAQKAIFHTEQDRFEAFGASGTQVETEFDLDSN
ncbi:MAG: LptA/OstA family protein [Candidatus Sericytochromatia bacterium]|nr:LptA/OstA family protein [Candidatus Sericytochromatia bacterium]